MTFTVSAKYLRTVPLRLKGSTDNASKNCPTRQLRLSLSVAVVPDYPFSINTDLIDNETPARLAVSHVPHSAEGSDALHMWSGVGKLAVPAKFEEVLHPLAMQPATTPAQASERSGIDVAEMLKFWAFGFENGLLHNPAQ